MRKILKITAVIIVTFAVLALAGVIVLKRMFPPEKIKALVEKEAAHKLHREVKFGDVRLSLFRGISIKDFALSEKPDFKRGTFVESKAFVLKFQLLPLLSKQVIIDQVSLVEPKIRVVRNADGKTFNFSDLSASTAAAAAPQTETPAEAGAPMQLTVSKASIVSGKVEFVDKSAGKMKITVSPLNVTMTGTGLDKPMAVDASLSLDSWMLGKSLQGDLTLKSVVDLPAQTLKLDSLRWKMKALTVDVKGSVAQFSSPNPVLDISVSVHDIDFKELASLAPVPAAVKISGAPEILVVAKGTLNDIAASLTVDLDKASVAYADLFKKDETVGCSATAKVKIVKQQSVSVESVLVKLAGLEATVQGEVGALKSLDPTLNIKVKTNSFNLSDIAKLSALAQPYAPAGQVQLDVSANGSLQRLKANGTLTLSGLKATVQKYTVENVAGTIRFTENSATLEKLSGRLASSGKQPADFSAEASVKDFKNPDVTLTADLQTLDFSLFMSDKKKDAAKPQAEEPKPAEKAPYKGPVISAQGNMTVNKFLYTKFEGEKARVSWKLTGITPVLDRINGTLDLETGKGKIHQIPLLSSIAPIAKLDPSGLVYSKITGHWDMVQGTAKTDNFKILSPAADLFVKGTLYLPTNKPDMTLTAKLPKGSIGGTVGELSNDAEGRPTFVFKLKNNWKPELDTSQAQKKVVEKATQEIKKRGEEILKNEGQKLLEGLFKR